MVYSKKSSKRVFSMKKKVSYKARPARFPSGKRNYLQTRSVAQAIKNISETKLKPLREQNSIVPKPVELAPTNGPCYFTNYCLGQAPASWLGPNGQPAFESLQGFTWPQGTQSDNRVGRYLYLKRTTLQIQLKMLPQSRHGETRFRIIVYKSKRNAPLGTAGGNPCDNLFINHAGNALGVNNLAQTEARATNFSTWLINKRNYVVVSDKMCVLAPQQNSAQGSTEPFNINQTKPSEKDMRFSLGHYQKADFNSFNQPSDSNYQYCVTIISMPTSSSETPHNDFRTYARGTVSVVDN